MLTGDERQPLTRCNVHSSWEIAHSKSMWVHLVHELNKELYCSTNRDSSLSIHSLVFPEEENGNVIYPFLYIFIIFI